MSYKEAVDAMSAVCDNFDICSHGCPFKVDGRYTCNTDNEDYIFSVYNEFFGIKDDDIKNISDSDIDSILND